MQSVPLHPSLAPATVNHPFNQRRCTAIIIPSKRMIIQGLDRLDHLDSSLAVWATTQTHFTSLQSTVWTIHSHLKGLICGEHCQVRELDTCRDAQGFAAKAYLSVAGQSKWESPIQLLWLLPAHPWSGQWRYWWTCVWTEDFWGTTVDPKQGTIGHEVAMFVFVSHLVDANNL